MSDRAEQGDGGTAGGPPIRAPARPIALYLFVLAVVSLVPAFVFSAYLLARNNEAQARILSSLTVATTQAIANAVDRQLEGLSVTLRVLESSRALSETTLEAFHERATRALAGTGAYILVLDESLQQLLNTRLPYGAPLGRTSNPESSLRALETGRQVVSGVFFGKTAQTWVFNVIRPLSEQVPAGARLLILTQNAENLTTALAARELPPGWHVALIDAGASVITSSPGSGIEPGTTLPLAFDADPTRQGSWQTVDFKGTPSTAVFWNVADAGWRVAAWAPKAAVEQPLAEALWSLVVGGILLAGAVVLVVYWVSLQIGRSVHGLEDDARSLGAGAAVAARPYPVAEIATVSSALADASSRRKAAETEVRLLMRELAHRSKNQLAVITAMAKQSARHAASVPDFVASLERRIQSLARSTDLLLAQGPSGIDLRDVLVRQIDPLCPIESGRVTLTGADIRINTQSAQILGMGAHELAANAARHGAFADETGTLEVNWGYTPANDALELVWRERVRRARPSDERRGFGTTVLETMVGRSLNAEVKRSLHPDGIEWRVVVPRASIDLARDPASLPDSVESEK